ncbi:MAG: hypothetical protein V4473_02855 [Patescibacteria group bacterium]
MQLLTRADLEKIAEKFRGIPVTKKDEQGKPIEISLDWRVGRIGQRVVGKIDRGGSEFSFGELVLYYSIPDKGTAYACKNPMIIDGMKTSDLKSLQISLIKKVVPLDIGRLE